MTAVNEIYGDFAQGELMFMVLNRRYKSNFGGTPDIVDLTTYIDPQMYNYAFANTRLDAQKVS